MSEKIDKTLIDKLEQTPDKMMSGSETTLRILLHGCIGDMAVLINWFALGDNEIESNPAIKLDLSKFPSKDSVSAYASALQWADESLLRDSEYFPPDKNTIILRLAQVYHGYNEDTKVGAFKRNVIVKTFDTLQLGKVPDEAELARLEEREKLKSTGTQGYMDMPFKPDASEQKR